MKAGDGKVRSNRRQRTIAVGFRCTSQEAASLDARAAAANMTRGEFARAAALGAAITRVRRDDAAVAALIRIALDLDRIRANFQRIANVTEATGTQPLPPVFQSMLEDLAVVRSQIGDAMAALDQGDT